MIVNSFKSYIQSCYHGCTTNTSYTHEIFLRYDEFTEYTQITHKGKNFFYLENTSNVR